MDNNFTYKFPPGDIRGAGFEMVQSGIDGGAFRKGNLTVIISFAVELDGKTWLHLSIARPNRYPPYEEVKRIEELFIGKDKKAIWILPPESEHINIHKYCFHLFHCLDGDPLPDFTHGTGSL